MDLQKNDSKTQIEEINVRRLQLYSQLFLYGDIVPLKFKINSEVLDKELLSFKDQWVPYNVQKGERGRMGLSVTSLDGKMSGYPDLQSLYQYGQDTGLKVSENDFTQLTEVYDKVPSVRELLEYFKDHLGRSRFVRFKAGGHFPPHRDHSLHFQMPDYFRLFVPLSNTGEDRLFFIYDNKIIPYEPGRVYLFNALKTHTVFSVIDDTLTLALSLRLSQSAIAKTHAALHIK